jgi:hypothetical protein
MRSLCILFIKVMIVYSCTSQRVSPHGVKDESSDTVHRIDTNNIAHQKYPSKQSLKEISLNSKKYIGKRIPVYATYLGYAGKDCSFPTGFCTSAPKTRSDWIISDGGLCAYVTGGKPAGFNPMAGEKTKVHILVEVSRNSKNQIYFIYISKFNNHDKN